jgi:NADH:ubiquinone oxidoreductase subunit C
MTDVLARRDRALTPEETEALLRDRLGDEVERSTLEYGVFTVWISQAGWAEAALRCRDEPLLVYDMFDNLFGVDAREDGFDVVVVLYSTSTGNRLALRTRCAGGREQPTCPSITEAYRGANWMERETYDMFGIVFEGHPGLEPRLLTVENFEGYPLRKDFHLASRAAKPWPGVKEPAELDEDGNVIERVQRIGDAPGPYELDKAMAEQAKLANPMPDAPGTVEGEQVEAGAAQADTAEDSGKVLADGVEQELEDDQAQTHDADVEVAGDQADEAGEAMTERAAEGEADEDAAAQARQRADERRRKQAEARARKAAERTQTGDLASQSSHEIVDDGADADAPLGGDDSDEREDER